jgi:alpha-N-arabinofuranosidase
MTLCRWRLGGAVLALLSSIGLALPPQQADARAPSGADAGSSAQSAQNTTITVRWNQRRGVISDSILGVNHRFARSAFGAWDEDADRPEPIVVRRLIRAGVSIVRFPGGKIANLFDWKRSIGVGRGCQVNGRVTPGGYVQAPRGAVYGPDEHMDLVHAVGADAEIMVPFATETPRDAADWVEYMNAPSNSPGNPNGGVDWADRRAANGHRAPYHVTRWEIGNEHRFKYQRYWMSADHRRALEQYVHGGSRQISNEALGKDCDHPLRGIPSDGSAAQVFEILFPPVAPPSVDLTVGGVRWRRVEDVSTAGPDSQVFTLNRASGSVRFGDGEHGAIPPKGTVVRASYQSVHPGVFAFIKAMERVDPDITVCPSWGLPEFARAAAGHHYGCLTAHSYTHFRGERHADWSSRVEGHDWHMVSAAGEFRFIRSIQQSLPRGAPVALSEFGVIMGNARAYPHWYDSMTHALYMATQWIHWLRLRIPWALGNDLMASDSRALLGPPRDYVFTAEAVTRTAIKPMFAAGGRTLAVEVDGNRRRDPGLPGGPYPALVVAASRDHVGHLYLLVVNRLPQPGGAVRTLIRTPGLRHAAAATLREVESSAFHDWNGANHQHAVHLHIDRRKVGRGAFSMLFPAHSIMLIRLGPTR